VLKILRKTLAASLFGASACAASLTALTATPVLAQDNPFGDNSERIIVSAPRERVARSRLGGPIVDVSLSRTLRVDDLDLNTSDGMDRLRWRVSFTARTLCDRLDRFYPIAVDGSPPCYRQAVRQAMASVGVSVAEF
jgi:UrcA family protein